MQGMGVREWASLMMLAAAVLVAASFYLPDGGDSSEPRAVSLGEVNPGDDDEQPAGVIGPARWSVRYVTREGDVVQRERVAPLELAFDVAPLTELEEGGWQLVAEGTAETPDGDQSFEIEYAGAVQVSVNGEVVFTADDPGEVTRAEVRFSQPEGVFEALVVIQVRQDTGSVVLRWLGPS